MSWKGGVPGAVPIAGVNVRSSHASSRGYIHLPVTEIAPAGHVLDLAHRDTRRDQEGCPLERNRDATANTSDRREMPGPTPAMSSTRVPKKPPHRTEALCSGSSQQRGREFESASNHVAPPSRQSSVWAAMGERCMICGRNEARAFRPTAATAKPSADSPCFGGVWALTLKPKALNPKP